MNAPERLRLGLMAHPSRRLEDPVGELRTCARKHRSEIVSVQDLERPRNLGLPVGEAGDCDLVVAIGGDGTTLAALASAAPSARPVLGVACGSLGALTTVPADRLGEALELFSTGRAMTRAISALSIRDGGERSFTAYNDLSLIRAGEGQARVHAFVNGELYARFAGDGAVLSTAHGSSAYTLACGGPLLVSSLHATVLTPISVHGGFVPPLVVPGGAPLSLRVSGFGGVRLEIDGRRVAEAREHCLEVALRERMATLVGLDVHEPQLSGLRRRGIIQDSPRIVAEDGRERGSSETDGDAHASPAETDAQKA